MEKDQSISVKDAVYKLQLNLLEGVKNEGQLFAAGSIISRSDYQDVVTERTIANLCGYPLCGNSLPSDRPQKGRYRISLKEHKVYDLHETYMYCSSSCVINSRAFTGSLQEERCSVLNAAELNEVLRLFEDLNLDSEGGLGKNGDLGFSNLKIVEKTENVGGEVSLEQWIGPSNAVEGYIPQRGRNSKASPLKIRKEDGYLCSAGSKANDIKDRSKEDCFANHMDFTSSIISEDEYNISKPPSSLTGNTPDANIPKHNKKEVHKGSKDRPSIAKMDDSRLNANDTKESSRREFFVHDMDFTSTVITEDEYSISKTPSGLEGTPDVKTQRRKEKRVHKGSKGKSSAARNDESSKTLSQLKGDRSKGARRDELSYQDPSSPSNSYQTSSIPITAETEEKSQAEKASKPGKSMLKMSLKTFGAKKFTRSVTWADEKVDSSGSRDLCEVREIEDKKAAPGILDSMDMRDCGNMLKFESAEACAIALRQAADAVSSGDRDTSDAMSEAGLIILPHPHDSDQGDPLEAADMLEEESSTLKWPAKSGIPQSEFFDPEDSWYDAPPEGFILELSSFATMWMALFAWVTSSSLAYIYGKDESSHEDFLMVNGREYPRKIFLGDGRSSEIRQTIAGCLSRALPVVVADLRLPIPISRLEQGARHLLDTISFVDALPAFRMKQWQVIALLFIEALSICRTPALVSYTDTRRMVLQKVVDGAQISLEEYEVMKDLMIPLGRAPQFSPQCGA